MPRIFDNIELPPQVAVSLPAVAGQMICRVTAQPAPKPAYVEGKVFIRTGNSTRELNLREAVEYARTRWP